ncbi:hypothetical protein Pse7367_1329 [Thalassoporum mexicanum PCC 7367]|nr:hypothetical protein Pse7367_1329 [Pseudanabaena sp. PCC 7367]
MRFKTPTRWISYIASLALLATAFPAAAERKEVDLRLPTRNGEDYTVLVRRAETLARTAAQSMFDREILVSDVSIKITAEDQAQAALVLQMNVTRSDWYSRPDPRIWSTYFPVAQDLLQL